MPPGPLRPLVQGCRLLGIGMPSLGRAVHLRPDDNPLGLHVEFHVHDLPRRGNPKNLTVKICALHRESLAAPGHLPQEFPPKSIKSPKNFEGNQPLGMYEAVLCRNRWSDRRQKNARDVPKDLSVFPIREHY